MILMRFLVASLLCGGLMLTGQSLSGRRAPSFSLPDSNQVQHDILDYRGKWLLMTFISTQSCPHCIPVSKELEKLQSSKIAVLYVMLPPENYNTGTLYATQNKLTSPVVFDTAEPGSCGLLQGDSSELQNRYAPHVRDQSRRHDRAGLV